MLKCTARFLHREAFLSLARARASGEYSSTLQWGKGGYYKVCVFDNRLLFHKHRSEKTGCKKSELSRNKFQKKTGRSALLCLAFGIKTIFVISHPFASMAASSGQPYCRCGTLLSRMSPRMIEIWGRFEGERRRWYTGQGAYFCFCTPCHNELWPKDVRSQGPSCRQKGARPTDATDHTKARRRAHKTHAPPHTHARTHTRTRAHARTHPTCF